MAILLGWVEVLCCVVLYAWGCGACLWLGYQIGKRREDH